jgi:diguanylate cyclase (GGDEF)-like protein
MLDIRTLSLSTLLFSFIYGIGLMVYASNHRKFHGISTIGVGFLFLGGGFLLIGLRQYINEFISVIIANSLLFVSIILIYEGLIQFRKCDIRWGKYLEIIMFIIMLPSFAYFTYIVPNVNARIIIFAICFFFQCSLCAYALLYRSQQNGGIANSLLGSMFLLFAIFYLFRAIATSGESELNDFMQAGLVHAISIIVFQMLVLFTCFTVIWIASDLLEKELTEQARIDPLTNIFNRRALEERANAEMIVALRSHRPLSIILTDIDHFKSFNDTHGHQVGDRILYEFANLLKKSVRENDFVARYGGEEFIILLPETTRQQATAVAEKLRLRIQTNQYLTSKYSELKMTASFGVSNFQEGMDDWKQIVKAADHALYEAKNKGRNCVVVDKLGDNWTSIKIK